MAPGPPTPPVTARPSPRRLHGVDAARGMAVLGMVAVHTAGPAAPDGGPSWMFLAFAGVASTCFVLLAGVSLALSWPAATTPAARPRQTAALLTRAGLLFVLGLLLGMLESPAAVILCHYGVLFALAPPLLRLPARQALARGVAWTLLGPVLVYAVTTLGWLLLGRTAVSVDGRLWSSPVPADLLRPHVLASDLLLTGYYPLLSWGGFLLLGIGLGRLLEEHRAPARTAEATTPGGLRTLAARMAACGGACWAVGAVLWVLLPHSAAVRDRIALLTGVDPRLLEATLLTGEPALVWLIPDPLWLLLAVPHGGGAGEALRTAGAAVTVLGLCLLAAERREAGGGPGLPRPAMAPLAAVGRIPLTLYTGHLVVLTVLAAAGLHDPAGAGAAPGWRWDGTVAVLVAWGCCAAVAAAVRAAGGRGPVEAGLQAAVRGVVGR